MATKNTQKTWTEGHKI